MARKKINKAHKGKVYLKKGDKVIVLSGDHKGSTGEVLEVNHNTYRAVVDQVNLVKKHQKPAGENPGGIIDVPAGIHISNLALVDPSDGHPTRIGRKRIDGKLVRYSKKSGETI